MSTSYTVHLSSLRILAEPKPTKKTGLSWVVRTNMNKLMVPAAH